ncbi:hypothetical protein [Granulicella sp. dw_53]|uniref:hypothetical protein n=1 Tax=Granulicella sp. dw_53 TaxID=2719792 RepID=UPI001BD5C8B2|nr:hypothetical protein [Granulicella sp. dw_53]
MTNIVEKIDAEIARLQMARAALVGTTTPAQLSPRHAKELTATLKKVPGAASTTFKKRKMSAAGRARIAAAQKARWAKLKRTVKSSPIAKKVAGKKPVAVKKSASAKKALSRTS